MSMTEDMVILISDAHIGRKTDSYNVDVFRERMRVLRDRLYEIKCMINRDHAIGGLHIFVLGDIIDGHDIYRGQAYEQEFTIDDMIDTAHREFVGFISWFVNSGFRRKFDFVDVHCVYGNHGRVKTAGTKTNWDKVLYKLLRETYSDNEHVNVTVYDKWYGVAEIKGWKYLLLHGDSLRSSAGIPYYGLTRNVLRWKTGGIDEDFDCVCMGHWHTIADICVNNVRVLMNGTMLSGDDFVEKFGLKAQNKFWTFGVNEEKYISWQAQIDIGDDE